MIHRFLSPGIIAIVILGAAPAQAQKVMPTSTGTGDAARFTFTMGPLKLQAGPKNCGRIFSVTYNSVTILHMDTSVATNYGSTFWSSPQLSWASDWPPSANMDGATADTAVVTRDSVLLLKGVTDVANQVRLNKEFWANTGDSSFNYHYTIVNTGTAAKSWGPWEDTRIDTGGIYLFPMGTDTITGTLATFTSVDSHGIVWYQHGANTVLASGSNKFYSDGSEGWYAHVTGARMLLIKKFSDSPAAKKAPSPEDEIEFFATNKPLSASSFIEMEVQGPYTSIAPGDSLQWDMTWYVRKIPDSVSVTVGNQAIVDYINQVIRGSSTSLLPASRPLGSHMNYSGGRVTLDMDESSEVSLSLINSNGREVSRIYSGRLSGGHHAFTLEPASHPGIYWLRLKTPGAKRVSNSKMVVLF